MALYLLDTDTLTLLQANHPEVIRRFETAATGEVVTSVITVEEVLTGWYNIARIANKPQTIERTYGELADAVAFYNGLPILNFIIAAVTEYDRLKSLKLNVGKNDLRIASIALVNHAIVVTRNASKDFRSKIGLSLCLQHHLDPPPLHRPLSLPLHDLQS